MGPRFDWDSIKAVANLRKHGVAFETARRVFADPLAIVEQDRIEGGEYRWRAIGSAGGVAVLVVAHTTREEEIEIIRIISARYATRTERRQYEEQDRQQHL